VPEAPAHPKPDALEPRSARDLREGRHVVGTGEDVHDAERGAHADEPEDPELFHVVFLQLFPTAKHHGRACERQGGRDAHYVCPRQIFSRERSTMGPLRARMAVAVILAAQALAAGTGPARLGRAETGATLMLTMRLRGGQLAGGGVGAISDASKGMVDEDECFRKFASGPGHLDLSSSRFEVKPDSFNDTDSLMDGMGLWDYPEEYRLLGEHIPARVGHRVRTSPYLRVGTPAPHGLGPHAHVPVFACLRTRHLHACGAGHDASRACTGVLEQPQLH